MSNKIIILGAGGHAKVIADIALKCGYEVCGFLDDNAKADKILGFPILGKIEDCLKFTDCEFVIGIGSNAVRKMLSEKYALSYATLIHPSAQIGAEVTIGNGTVVMANAVINPCTVIGNHVVINTASVVEHDNVIENYVHISPRAVTCGTVKIGEGVHVGAGATVINNISVCSGVIIGAGAAVVKNIAEKGTYVGVPAKIIKR